MGMGKESGIYMSVGLDSSELIQDMAKLRAQAGNAGEQISKALGGSLTTAKLRNDIVGLTTDLSKATAAAKNLNVPIKLDGLDAVARNAGIATTKVNDLYGAMVNTANAKAYENALAHIQKQAGLTSVEMAKLRREAGDVSGALNQAMGALNRRQTHNVLLQFCRVICRTNRHHKPSSTHRTDFCSLRRNHRSHVMHQQYYDTHDAKVKTWQEQAAPSEKYPYGLGLDSDEYVIGLGI